MVVRAHACLLGLMGCVVALVGCDHATKLAAESTLRDRAPLSVVPGVLDLEYTENHGVAFSALERLAIHPAAWVLVVLALVATAAVSVVWLRRARKASLAEHAGFALVIAGALGNGIDRFARGHVVDFVHVRFWPVFNVADVLVVVGMALLVLAWRRTPPAQSVPGSGVDGGTGSLQG
jgi:signal peptidase II